MRLAFEAIAKTVQQARFADPRLALDKQHWGFSLLCLRPTLEQEGDLFLTSDHRHQTALGAGLKAAPRTAFSPHSVYDHRLGNALEVHGTEFVALEQAFDQSMRTRRDQHAVGLRLGLQAGGEIRCGAHGKLRLIAFTRLLPDDYRASGNADSHRQRFGE